MPRHITRGTRIYFTGSNRHCRWPLKIVQYSHEVQFWVELPWGPAVIRMIGGSGIYKSQVRCTVPEALSEEMRERYEFT